jgi:four helix bundle protein
MSKELKQRLKHFALMIIEFAEKLPKNQTTFVLGRQILKSGTSIGANYYAACRARSRAEFIAKLGIVEEEADETIYWLDLLAGSKSVNQKDFEVLRTEANEILSIIIRSIKTARQNYV